MIDSDPTDVEAEALRQLLVVVLSQWSDDRLEDAIKGLRKTPLSDLAPTSDRAFLMGAGRAAQIIGGILDGRYATEDYEVPPPDPNAKPNPDMPF